ADERHGCRVLPRRRDRVAHRAAGECAKELVEEAQRLGARRKFLARGEGGYYSQVSEFPPGYTVPEHSHDHNEMLVILRGSCTILGGDGPTLEAGDSAVLIAN